MRRHWPVLVGAVLLGVLVAGVVVVATPKTYTATATVALRWIGRQPGVAELANARYLTREAETVALLVERADVLQTTADLLDEPRSPSWLEGRIEATVPLDTQLVRISGSAGGPTEAADVANMAAAAVVTYSANGLLSPSVDTQVVVSARAPVAPALPKRGAYLMTGLLIGLVVGVVGVLIAARRGVPRPDGAPVDAGEDTPKHGRSLSDRQLQRLPYLVWVILIAASIPWRTGTFYEGGADPVVLAKASLSLVALGIGLWAVSRSSTLLDVPAVPVLLLALYLGVTLVGGIANQTTMPSMIVAVRVAILAATLCLMAGVVPAAELMRRLVHVLGALMFMGATTGFMANPGGRLGGAIPMLNPNLLALLAVIVTMWLVAKVFMAQENLWELAVIGICLVIILQTGSRTALAALGERWPRCCCASLRSGSAPSLWQHSPCRC
ncbi:hypothetical protein G7085_05170 [Tessaracoccus sp. HDW20]|nr:hypothetical protein [Tessaracoccus coleopterorum]